MEHSDDFEGQVICYICNVPINGTIGRFRDEPIHTRCRPT